MRLSSDKRRNSTVVIFLTLGATAFISGCGEQQIAQETIRPVKATVVQPAAKEKVLTFSGVLAPRIESSLGFRVSGKIVERSVNVGDEVKSGQRIARLDETDLKLSENSARVQVIASKTRLAVAKDALARAKTLLPNKFIAQSTVDQRQLEVDSAQSSFDAAQDQFNQAVNATSYAVLVADKNGIVTSVRAEPGQVVTVGQAIVTLAQAGDIEATAAVPEQEITSLKQGQKAEVALWSAPDVRTTGVIREIAGAADAASRTYAVKVSIPAPTPEMRLGMTASVAFKVPLDQPGVFIPLSALTSRNGKTFAFVANKDTETVSEREILLGGISDAGAKVAMGLAPGEIVVTGGVQFMREGLKVRLPKEILTNVADSKR